MRKSTDVINVVVHCMLLFHVWSSAFKLFLCGGGTHTMEQNILFHFFILPLAGLRCIYLLVLFVYIIWGVPRYDPLDKIKCNFLLLSVQHSIANSPELRGVWLQMMPANCC